VEEAAIGQVDEASNASAALSRAWFFPPVAHREWRQPDSASRAMSGAQVVEGGES
jgi:hypothetical protein